MKPICVLFASLLLCLHLAAQEKGVRINELSNSHIHIKPDTGSVSSVIRQAIRLKETQVDSAIELLQATLTVSRDINYTLGIGRSLNVLGLCYNKKENFDQAIIEFKEALRYLPSAKGQRTRMEIFNNLSAVYNVKGDYMTGIDFLYQAINEAQRNDIEDAYTLANLYCNLGGELLNVGENDKAWSYLQKAKIFGDKLGDNIIQARIYTDMAGVYYQNDNTDSALPLFQKALQVSRHLNNISLQKNVLQNIGKLYIKRKELPQGIAYLDSALKINSNSYADDLMIYYDLGNAWYQMKEYKKAEKVLLMVKDIAENRGVKSHLTDAYLTLAALYAETGRYKQAYEEQKAYTALYDSILNEASAKQFSQEETKYQTAEKDRDIVHKQLLLSQQSSKLKEKNILIASISAILLLIIALSFIVYNSARHRQKIAQLKAIMEGEEKERKRIARDLHDGISQTMSAAKINLMAIEKEIAFTSADQKQKFDKIVGMVDEGFREVRTISHNMMPNALLESGLELVIRQFVDNIDPNIIRISLHSRGFEKHFDGTIETILYRVIQECVTNVIKHANATQLDISLIRDNDGISVTIEDNGRGFSTSDIESFTGIGLRNIYSRLALVQGKVEFDSSADNGTLVSIFIPSA